MSQTQSIYAAIKAASVEEAECAPDAESRLPLAVCWMIWIGLSLGLWRGLSMIFV